MVVREKIREKKRKRRGIIFVFRKNNNFLFKK